MPKLKLPSSSMRSPCSLKSVRAAIVRKALMGTVEWRGLSLHHYPSTGCSLRRHQERENASDWGPIHCWRVFDAYFRQTHSTRHGEQGEDGGGRAKVKNEKILALIEMKKRDSMKKTLRRSSRHCSSYDGEFDESDDDCRNGLKNASSIYTRQTESSSRRDGSSDPDSDMPELDVIAAAEKYQSRYHGDFHDTGLLGHGRGGEVVKVRNRLDRQFYAVKKVKLDPDEKTMKKKILREVKTISRMQHRHIVRYILPGVN